MGADVSREIQLGVALAAILGIAAVAVAASSSDVEVRLFQFRPARLEVPTGTPVQWTNRDDVVHTVTAGTPDAPGPSFRLDLEGRGATVSQTFAERGVLAYFCERHHHMRGEIRVQ